MSKARGRLGPPEMGADSLRRILLSNHFRCTPKDLCKVIANVINWRRILLSNHFRDAPANLCKVVANVIKILETKKVSHRNLELYLTYSLTLLDKNPSQ